MKYKLRYKRGSRNAPYELDARLAENDADNLEWDANLAIDYAIAAVDQARLAVLDAVDGRIHAIEARRAS